MRETLIEELFHEVRAEHEDVQAFDEEAARLLGINLTDLRVLGLLDRGGPRSVSELAEEAGLTSGSAARTCIGRIWGPLGAEAAALVERYSTEELALLVGYLRRGRRLLQGHRVRLMELDPSSWPNGAPGHGSGGEP